MNGKNNYNKTKIINKINQFVKRNNCGDNVVFYCIDTDNINSVFICSDGAWHLMYKRNRMYESFKSLLINQEYVKLKDVLSSAERYDDCSFISADISDLRRGRRK
jgi:hypothetical protein